VLFFCGVLPVLAEPLSPAEERGRYIYLSGESPAGGDISAYFGNEDIELPGSSAACGRCHGPDGTGRPESGITPFNITWPFLSKSYGHSHPNGLHHPPFNPDSLKFYLQSGTLPGGDRSDPAMPRFDMSDRDLDDLVAYLQRLGETLTPGVSPSTILIGCLLPAEPPLHDVGAEIEACLKWRLEERNRAGGIHGRKLELQVLHLPAEAATAKRQLAAWLDLRQPLLLLANLLPGLEQDLQPLLNERQIPLLGPLSLTAEHGYGRNRLIFYLLPDLRLQLRALLDFSRDRLPLASPALLVVSEGPPDPGLQQELSDWTKANGWPAPRFLGDPRDPGLAEPGEPLWLVIGESAFSASVAVGAAALSQPPQLLLFGPLAGSLPGRLPKALAGRVHFAYPVLPDDRSRRGRELLGKLLERNLISRSHLQLAAGALAAEEVLAEALRRSGRRLDRERLYSALEALYDFPTGLLPPVSFDANRRTGIRGAHVVTPRPDPTRGLRFDSLWVPGR